MTEAASSARLTLTTLLKAALLAGLIAALLTGLFHFVFSEPVVDAAIALESAGGGAEAPEVVDRNTQKAGLFIAWLLYGAIWASLVGAAAHVLRVRSRVEATAVAAAFGWGVALVPALKYPANPPGVGDPESLLLRQAAYLACLGVGLVAASMALPVARRFGPVWAGATYAVLLLAAFLVLPPNPDAVSMPPEVLVPFRALSLVGLGLFWVVFVAGFAVLCARRVQSEGLPLTSRPA